MDTKNNNDNVKSRQEKGFDGVYALWVATINAAFRSEHNLEAEPHKKNAKCAKQLARSRPFGWMLKRPLYRNVASAGGRKVAKRKSVDSAGPRQRGGDYLPLHPATNRFQAHHSTGPPHSSTA